ncbi:hypothetical protein BJV82DRAFT_583541 [Fennellomyces sp. T-0311]|nr:hypothetical protein BJV82DRAFT_583541 [Fennellomyces sp. T-0311]
MDGKGSTNNVGASFPITFKRGEGYSLYSKKALDLLSIHSAFPDGKNTYFNRKFDFAIDSTVGIAALEDVMRVLCLHRAAVYEMQGKYNQSQFQKVLVTLESGIQALPILSLERLMRFRKREDILKKVNWHNQTIISAFPDEVLSHIFLFTRPADQSATGTHLSIMGETCNALMARHMVCSELPRLFRTDIAYETLPYSYTRNNPWRLSHPHTFSIAAEPRYLEAHDCIRDRELAKHIQLIVELVNEQSSLQSLTADFTARSIYD